MKLISDYKSFAGRQLRYQHQSTSLSCSMMFSVFLPEQAEQQRVPVLYWLSGLTCSDENFVLKAGAQQYANKYGIAIVAPDTSPRGDDVADASDGAYDLGLGAGFYVDATEEPWHKHYQMHHYISHELPNLVWQHLPIEADRAAIFGHSMGGHGALTIGLKHPEKYRSISAFAPICAPSQCPWGDKALTAYLGENKALWQQYDSVALLNQLSSCQPILIDQGSADEFLSTQLKPELLLAAVAGKSLPISYRLQAGYDHSYFFIASFIEQHIAFHVKHLR
ncbi:S-formylglutathione hydrolase [Thalassotalea maritima]|uniref:S-formylglutathione hydrolase n=1 Tax=Thalassotalea maritima TaxID=3242416 RepID=UPI003528BE6C